MFDELKKYKKNDHFFLMKDGLLSDVSKKVPDMPGVFYIIKLAKGRVELVYIGKSGMANPDDDKNQLLRSSINDLQNGTKGQIISDQKFESENIDGLDIYWFVTFDERHKDLPAFVEGTIMQRHFDIYGKLPKWNR